MGHRLYSHASKLSNMISKYAQIYDHYHNQKFRYRRETISENFSYCNTKYFFNHVQENINIFTYLITIYGRDTNLTTPDSLVYSCLVIMKNVYLGGMRSIHILSKHINDNVIDLLWIINNIKEKINIFMRYLSIKIISSL